MGDLGAQLVWWVMVLVFLAAAVLWGLTFCVLWVLDRVTGWRHRRCRPRLE